MQTDTRDGTLQMQTSWLFLNTKYEGGMLFKVVFFNYWEDMLVLRFFYRLFSNIYVKKFKLVKYMKIATRFYMEKNITENWFPIYYACLNTPAGAVLCSLK